MQFVRLALVTALIASGFGCKQLLKSADELGDVARRSDGVGSGLRHAANGFKHSDGLGQRIAALSFEVGPDVLEATMEAMEGEDLAAEGADLTGTWTLRHEDDNATVLSTLERKRMKPGVFATRGAMTVEIDGDPIASVDLQGVEVFSDSKVCSQTAAATTTWTRPDLPPSVVAELKKGFSVEEFNKDPCSELITRTADTLAYKMDGALVTETRE